MASKHPTGPGGAAAVPNGAAVGDSVCQNVLWEPVPFSPLLGENRAFFNQAAGVVAPGLLI